MFLSLNPTSYFDILVYFSFAKYDDTYINFIKIAQTSIIMFL